MRKISLNGRLDQFGCISDDRRVGPWTLVRDNAWNAPVWVRKGPEGYRNIFNDEVAYVSLIGFGAYAPDGLTEETGHVWGENRRTIEGNADVERLKAEMDSSLVGFGWTLSDDVMPQPQPAAPKTFWQKVITFIAGGRDE